MNVQIDIDETPHQGGRSTRDLAETCADRLAQRPANKSRLRRLDLVIRSGVDRMFHDRQRTGEYRVAPGAIENDEIAGERERPIAELSGVVENVRKLRESGPSVVEDVNQRFVAMREPEHDTRNAVFIDAEAGETAEPRRAGGGRKDGSHALHASVLPRRNG